MIDTVILKKKGKSLMVYCCPWQLQNSLLLWQLLYVLAFLRPVEQMSIVTTLKEVLHTVYDRLFYKI